MPNAELIDSLNRVLSLELAGVIQYLQHSFLVTGPEREVFREFFRGLSGEARDHAGFTADSLPIGLEILGRTLSDTRLVSMAFSYEQQFHPRRPPRTTPATMSRFAAT